MSPPRLTEDTSAETVEPSWLVAFPFIQQHWPVVSNIQQRYPTLDDYQLAQDWQTSRQQNHHLSLAAFMRRFRQTRLAYIASQDFLQPVVNHLTALHAVSHLADFLIQQAYEAAVENVSARYGLLRDEAGQLQQLQIFALGKLGSGELNYSSDIDLVFIYEQGGSSDGDKSLDAGRYFNRIGQHIIQLLDQYTDVGRVYQVDMRLRPFGSVGPLSCSVDALHQYLLSEGREWERFAWMRARQVAGDQTAGERIMATIKPFIYRRHLDYSVFESLAKIKSDMTLLTDYEADDLKYGLGGIRSVEFVVQSLQMTFGGRDETLQGVSIYQQIQQLYEARKLSTHDKDILSHGWLWLRKSENIIQAVDDLPNHEFTMSKALQDHIAAFFGQSNWSDYCRQLTTYRQQIDSIFRHLFADMATVEVVLTVDEQRLINAKMAELPLQRLPKSTSEKVHNLLQQTLLIGRQSSPENAHNEKRVHAAADPKGFHDDQQTPEITWQRLLQVIKAILKRPSYLSMLVKEQPVLVALLRLLQQHDYVANTVAQFPVLLELLFEPHDLPENLDESWLQDYWQQSRIRGDDVEQWMEALRYFKLSIQFLIICDWLNEEKDNRQTCHRLSQLAEFILTQVIEYSHKETCHKLKPTPESIITCQQLMVIAYGSLASGQMKLSSDMDLVFVLDCEELSNDQRHFMQRWVKRITHHLTARLYHGHLYDIDLQLRPNGNSGSLVTSLVEFANYQQNRAWVWEHAALIKSKLVYGTQAQHRYFKQLRQAILSQPRKPEDVTDALADMRAKLVKTDSSHQLEFEVMAAVLIHSHQYPRLSEQQYLSEMFNELTSLGLLESDQSLPKPPIPVN
ncbi:bifunctional [glutamate--ammonia ligase]-adenylyl-L-tyrosine phosphorylase/[glutamate--ammonia-ligase] adenylyltransferase [Marinicella gelatinilytica]|uniref:bifunctional [glutamate--ammonia ligase]-adenylyl-L-tyrosine phosphorylase/[glutamate--ammonia-ligase] adenylyltransferase n=1 Tax=Marinicella gelatinilytica TaxID=2996017 RepID=UPI002260CF8C|nr:bifunctional [glutamate--ammonia ligase]-adenylyl-L-tyrosine phosphorylase/[glutamate--ammonia-ligase] adenylyltransferase [Marinicella gelatinilytica]MCX7544051.1 bifunctional [glutamate--ammonia ligase]-adenylyl-L-tyrosine phosphorylase/[glutamate--ammonia-ligase] adenylyltransferase [Marinicella gelatinilytica]